MWLAAALLVPAAIEAQEPVPRDSPVLLTLDVSVVDPDGEQVPTLGPADFTVTAGGEPRRVVSVEYVPLHGREAAPGDARPRDAYFTSNRMAGPAGHFVLVLVDERHLHAEAADAGIAAIVALLDTLGAADRVALAAVPAPGVLVDFTTDRQRIREGLGSVLGRARRERGQPAPPASEARARARQALHDMRDVLARLAPIDGPKSAILISEGFGIDGLDREVDLVAATAAEVRASLDVLVGDATDDSRGQATGSGRIDDRRARIAGLDTIAALARGQLVPLVAPPARAASRLGQAMAGYFLLTVDARATDLDGPRHRLTIATVRDDLRVRTRGPFRIPQRVAAASPTDAVEQALRSLVPETGVPLRLATWTFKEPGGPGVRVLVAVEAALPADGANVTTGIVVVDDAGLVRTHAVEERQLPRHPRDPAMALYAAAVTVDPGHYRIRFVIADAAGRVGAVDRRVVASAVPGDGVVLGDLLVAAAPEGGPDAALAPTVEARIGEEPLAALLEVYSGSPAALADVTVALDIVRTEDGPALQSQAMATDTAAAPEVGTARALVDTSALAPGRYLARASVRVDGQEQGRLIRPFLVVPSTAGDRPRPAGAGGMATVPPAFRQALIAAVPPLDRERLLAPAALDRALSATADGRASDAGAALAEAAGGDLDSAALTALAAGDLPLATLLRGLAYFQRQDGPRALETLQSALQLEPALGAARLFFGASLVEAGRPGDAASLLQSVPAAVSSDGGLLAGEAWLRAAEPALAIGPLERAAAAAPDDSRVMRSLAFAYVLGSRAPDALPLLAAYLDGHGDDASALAAGVYATYARHQPTPRPASLDADRVRAARWADAYLAGGGPLAGLVEAWIVSLNGLR